MLYDTIANGNASFFDAPGPGGQITHYDFPPPANSVIDFDGETHSSWKLEPETEMPFYKVKQLRLIKMTPYQVGSLDTINWLVYVPNNYTSYGGGHFSECNGGSDSHSIWHTFVETTWDDVYDPIRLKQTFDLPQFTVDQSDIQSVLDDVSASAIADADSTLDVLTNLAEFPDTLRLLIGVLRAARNPLQGIRDLLKRYSSARRRGTTHLEAMSDLSDEWLQYRYGIMPLVYSIKDILELLDDQAVEFKTDRARDPVSLKNSPVSGNCYSEEFVGTVLCRAVVKTRFGDRNLRLSDQISINPFLTAWELIPFSFVIDWFLNVGDVIASQTLAFGDLATQRAYCRSVRKNFTLVRKFNYLADTRVTRTHGTNRTSVYCNGSRKYGPYCGGLTAEFGSLTQLNSTYQTVQENSYHRSLFKPTDVGLSWNPSLSWMRELDGIALTLRKLISSMR